MFKPFAAALIVTVSTAFGTAASAAEFNFTAFVNHTQGFSLDPLPRLGIVPGDTITGSFSYDQNARVGSVYEAEGSSTTYYEPPRGQVTPSVGQISFNFGSTPTTLQIAAIKVDDNFLNPDGFVREDEFYFVADSSPLFPAPIIGDDRGFTSVISSVYLTGTEAVFDSSALPTTLDLADFLTESSISFLAYYEGPATHESFSATITSLTDVTTVDTPFSGLLLASGCMMLWMRRKPNAKQT